MGTQGPYSTSSLWQCDPVYSHAFMVIDNYFLLFQKWMEEFPQWSSGEEFTCQCRGQGFNPWPGRCHMPWNNYWISASQVQSLSDTAGESMHHSNRSPTGHLRPDAAKYINMKKIKVGAEACTISPLTLPSHLTAILGRQVLWPPRETRAQTSWVTFPRPHSHAVAIRFKPRPD